MLQRIFWRNVAALASALVVMLIAACGNEKLPTLEITPGALLPVHIFEPYEAQLQVSGGVEPYSWSATGLPKVLWF